MAITYITYTKEQRASMSVSGYSLYVNGSHCSIYETVASIKAAANRYPDYNDIEVYPILKRSY